MRIELKTDKLNFAECLSNLSEFQSELFKISKLGNVTKTRKFIDDEYWAGSDINVSKYHLLDAIVRLDSDNLKLLKNYTNPLDKTAIELLKSEASDPAELEEFYRVIVKAGIRNISQSEFIEEAADGKIRVVKERDSIAIPEEWSRLLTAFQKHSKKECYLSGKNLSELYLGNKTDNEIVFLVNAHPLDGDNIDVIRKILKKAKFKIDKKIKVNFETAKMIYKGKEGELVSGFATYTIPVTFNKKDFNIVVHPYMGPATDWLGIYKKPEEQLLFNGSKFIKTTAYNEFLNDYYNRPAGPSFGPEESEVIKSLRLRAEKRQKAQEEGKIRMINNKRNGGANSWN